MSNHPMEATMQAIETRYDGHRFRSRAEARWAVFFNVAGLKYEYEREGVVLPSGPYLPDFYLPQIGTWIEVKGAEPTSVEWAKAIELSRATKERVLIAVGAPSAGGLLWPNRPLRVGDDPTERFHLLADRRDAGVFWLGAADESSQWCLGGPGKQTNHDRQPGSYGAVALAYEASRAARFEHGESGPPR